MLNLAPLRYADILNKEGGPIQKLQTIQLNWTGDSLYQANAYLSDTLNIKSREASVFLQADGCGTHPSLMIARHKAISESLERWALYHLYHSGNWRASGLDLDSTSAGMASYPGLFSRQARFHAQEEAIERYCLAKWAIGELPCQLISTDIPGVSAIQIQQPFANKEVVLSWKPMPSGMTTYGFSCSNGLQPALAKSLIEMDRLSRALQVYHKANPEISAWDLSTVESPLERRLLYFSLPSGHFSFLSTVRNSLCLRADSNIPKPVIDTRLRGPWDRYTSVWRVLYPMPNPVYSEDTDLFYW